MKTKHTISRRNAIYSVLAGKMKPKPDHGETSYKGSDCLKERKALITGEHSGMGRAAIIVLCFKINY